jgi:uncharacterized delta-60 repeat protein
MRRLTMLTTVFALALCTAAPAFASPGDLDPTFHGDGRVVVDALASADEFAGPIALQSDGKILVGVRGNDPVVAGIVRTNPDGRLDTSFGTDGVLVFPTLSTISDLAVDRGDRIVLVGVSADDPSVLFVMRLSPQGVADRGFHGGSTTIPVAIGRDAARLALLPGGDVLVAGNARSAAQAGAIFVAKLTAGGRLDTSFDGDGVRRLRIGHGGGASGLAVQPNGDIALVGGVIRYGGYQAAVARLTPTGALDATFGHDGLTFVPAIDLPDVDVALHDGAILVAGNSDHPSGDRKAGVARLHADGSLDRSFGGDGLAVHGMAHGDEYVTAMALQGSKIVVVGACSSVIGRLDFCVMRLLDDGRIDTTFGDDGRVRTDFRDEGDPLGSVDVPGGVAIQPDGKIVVGGDAAVDVHYETAIARYLNA